MNPEAGWDSAGKPTQTDGASVRLGVDVGGTFTDVVLVAQGAIRHVKVPSTPDNPARAVFIGVERACAEAGIALRSVDSFTHGTTVATNAVLESRLARVGLIVTQGFRQILHLARSETPGPLAGWINFGKPDPPADLEDTLEIAERMDARGAVVRALDEQAVRTALQALVTRGVESVAICLINSYANPAHERKILDLSQAGHIGVPIIASHEVLPEFREYERAITVTMTAALRPRVANYLSSLDEGLERHGFSGRFGILRSDGGAMSSETANDRPAHLLLSGPSGGVVGALRVATTAGYRDILTFDMGGTSTDVAVCQDGVVSTTHETRVGEFPVRIPAIDVRTVGAGGGSIAYVAEISRALRVGPQSAGAEPGPACYGHGGIQPTVTDANLVVGRLPSSLLGGEFPLDTDAARTAVEQIARQMDLSVDQAAEGILRIVNEHMLGALRLVTVQRGLDPRGFALLAFGGAGGLHACALAKLMGTVPVLVPPAPGLLCAFGDVVARYRSEHARTFIRTAERTDPQELSRVLDELEREGRDVFRRERSPSNLEIRRSADMRYFRQGYEISVPIANSGPANLQAIAADFARSHRRLYGFDLSQPIEFVAIRVEVSEPPSRIDVVAAAEEGSDSVHALIDESRGFFDGSVATVRHFDRNRLKPGNEVTGPAVITEMDSTTVVEPGFTARVDRFFNLACVPTGLVREFIRG